MEMNSFMEMIFVLQLIKVTQTKSKTVTCWSSRKRKKAFFVPFILSEGHFFNICVPSQCIMYWIYFQNIRTFIYQKALLHTLFCLLLKSPKALSVSLRYFLNTDKFLQSYTKYFEKIKKSSKVRQNRKTLISAVAYFWALIFPFFLGSYPKS